MSFTDCVEWFRSLHTIACLAPPQGSVRRSRNANRFEWHTTNLSSGRHKSKCRQLVALGAMVRSQSDTGAVWVRNKEFIHESTAHTTEDCHTDVKVQTVGEKIDESDGEIFSIPHHHLMVQQTLKGSQTALPLFLSYFVSQLEAYLPKT